MIPAILYCDECGTANRPQARFCFSCGQSLPAAAPLPSLSNPTIIKAPGDLSTKPIAANRLLKQRYRIIDQLGQGGFGAVYKAEDTRFGNRLVAVKEMSESGLSPREIARATGSFKHEALMLGGLMHPNLPRIYDHFFDAGHWYLVMDFIEGETLEEHLRHAVGVPLGIPLAGKRCLPVEEVLDIGTQLCTVLGYLHRLQPPIIFRDLKPANVMITLNGHVYLIDFGIARHFKPGQARDTIAFGSPGYAAPEQYGKEQTTYSADIYGLGVTLHQLLSGNDPADSPFHFAPLGLQSSPVLCELEKLIMQMVSMDRDQRPASMAIVKQELQRIAALQAASQAGAVFPVIIEAHPAGASPVLPTLSQTRDIFPPRGTTYLTYRGHDKKVLAVAWSPDGTRIASSGYDETVQIWDATSGKEIVIYRGHSAWVKAIAWSPDGTSIASAGADTTVHTWNASTGRNTLIYRGHPRIVSAVAWSPEGTRIASAGYDQKVLVWDAFTGRDLYTYHDHAGFVNALAWSPDGASIASASDDRTVHIWKVLVKRNLFTRHKAYIYRGHAGRVLAVAWAPNGARIASGSWDNTVQVWDANTGEFVHVHKGHSSWVSAVAWSPNSVRLASASNDGTVQVWEASTAREVFTQRHYFTYGGHYKWVRALDWSPDGERIASASHDKTVQVWQAA